MKLRIRGPAKGIVGQRVDFVITVSNTGAQPLTGVAVSFASDPDLLAVEADHVARLESDRVVWKLAELPLGESRDVYVRCRCARTAARACGRASMTTGDGLTTRDESCLEIRSGPGASGTTTPPAKPTGRLP